MKGISGARSVDEKKIIYNHKLAISVERKKTLKMANPANINFSIMRQIKTKLNGPPVSDDLSRSLLKSRIWCINL